MTLKGIDEYCLATSMACCMQVSEIDHVLSCYLVTASTDA